MDLDNKLKLNTCCTNDDESAGVYIIRDAEEWKRSEIVFVNWRK